MPKRRTRRGEVRQEEAKLNRRMKKRPLTPTSAGAGNLKIKFSQSEVQRLIEQEVHSAVNETKLQTLIESIQQLENGVDFERSIENLQVQINTLSEKAQVALAYVAKMQKQNAVPSPVGVNQEEGNTETVSQNSAKSGELFQIMETTRKALKKMRADSQALTAAMADLNEELYPTSDSPFEYEGLVSFIKTGDEQKNENTVEFKQFEKSKGQRLKIGCVSHDRPRDTEQERRGVKRTHEVMTAARTDLNEERPPPVLTPHWCHQLKQEPRDEQKKENGNEELMQSEEPKGQKVKAECASSVDINSLRYTDTQQNGLALPPLPPTPFPSVLNMEAASYSIPQSLEVNLALIRKPTSLSVLWKVAEEDPSAPPMDSYTIFLTMEKVKGSGVFPDWNILGEVKALNLPMCVLVRKYKPGHKVCAAVVGKDVFGRYGPYSKVATAVIPE
ncbi:uncharacterized protein atf7ip2 isoform X2 [Archocentrus centrarchus]|uniref:uncharacterized protein atf7ip2 isoform X2 n=1 Tax=Archocentrus centrarchus TaxID=63155 RepID=UPI0011EA2112|nr:activating transcription factor 7-interacting protein 2 isoform X2 [Archocentrus centrarchus]